jgi:hypothetical protein
MQSNKREIQCCTGKTDCTWCRGIWKKVTDLRCTHSENIWHSLIQWTVAQYRHDLYVKYQKTTLDVCSSKCASSRAMQSTSLSCSCPNKTEEWLLCLRLWWWLQSLEVSAVVSEVRLCNRHNNRMELLIFPLYISSQSHYIWFQHSVWLVGEDVKAQSTDMPFAISHHVPAVAVS